MLTQKRSVHFLLRALLALALLLALLGPAAPAVRAAGPYVVNIDTDGPDSNLSDGFCYEGVNGCSLRAAIQQASYDGVTATITFDSGLYGATLYLSNTYGTLYWPGSNITVDGQNNHITISGQNLADYASVIEIQGNRNHLMNISIKDSKWDGVRMGDFTGTGSGNYNLVHNAFIYHSAASGVYIHGSSSDGGNGNNVTYTLIGGASYADNLCATSVNNAVHGILIDGGADNSYIGHNRIVCSANDGIFIDGAGGGAQYTEISNNLIGTDGSSTQLGNGWTGVHDYLASDTVIKNNVISGNLDDGLWLHNDVNAVVTGNKIGTNEAGTSAIPNGASGILISDSATGSAIGSPTDVAKRNIISGNSDSGITLRSGANNNVMDGNYIGLGGSNGNIVIPNALAGVAFFDVNNNALSSGSASIIQWIAGNTREGVYAENSFIIINSATYIGLTANGLPAGNGLQGVMLVDSSNGFIWPGMVANNVSAGIAVTGNSSTGNDIHPEYVRDNGGLPVDLGNDGHTPNDPGDADTGPNDLFNYPELTGAALHSISGTSCAGCILYIYATTSDPTAAYGGGYLLTQTTANATNGTFTYTLPGDVAAVGIIACHPTADNCSEMSPAYSKTGRYRIYMPLAIKN